ncbi:DHH family phosphoesterase [Spiroplasma taiwanense]|uniref:DHH family protein n=1 Tax=Spiroplasma taiwanense CT-1 TaxID=1276220 RepID=S5MC79_9MOLU|nr:bifunctional oligoribonuclease/PAP phosphatase NrnA [Spiroplasma taiwanense]AGR41333.1 DHH family protein [Spiroplasma taiwanense CT-1]
MDLLKTIEEEIKKFQTIIIQRHVNPDGDAYGSQFGLKHLIENNFKDKKVYVVGDEFEWLSFLGKVDQIDDEVFSEALVIVTDCANVERISDQRFSKAKQIIKIDHHPNVTPYGYIMWVDVTFTSASEMVGYLAVQLNWNIPQEAARVIFCGTVTDSGRFLYRGTTARTFEVASVLLKTGFDLFALYKKLNTRKLSDLEFSNLIFNTFKLTKKGLAYVIISLEDLKKHNLTAEMMNKYANTLAGFEEIKVWITFSQFENKSYRVEFRSAETVINKIAAKYGGGGHDLAAGAIVPDLETINAIIKDIDELL